MTDFYIAKAGVVQGGQKYAEVAVAAPSATVSHTDRVGGATYSWASVYNTPKDSFDSIKMRKVRNTTGHITTLSVYSMGAIPDDQNTSEDDSETDRILRTDLLVASATHTQVVDNATGVDTDVVFDFNTTLSQANLGAAFTVVQSTTDGSGTRVGSSELRFDDRDALDYFTSPNDNQSTDSNTGGAGSTYYQVSDGAVWSTYAAGAQSDPCLAFELYNSTSISLGSDSNDGLSLSTPKATVASVQAITSFTSADKLFFRAGTYTTELAYGPDSNVHMEFDTFVELISLEAYEDEIVIFEMPATKSYMVTFANINGPSDTDLYSIRNIQFRNGAGDATTAFILFTQSGSSNKIIEFVVEGCTFTQLASEADLTHGALYASGTKRGTVRLKNNTFNIADARALNLTNQVVVILEDNTFNLSAPSSNDSSNAMFYISGVANPVMTSKVFIQNNTTTYNWAGDSGNNILHQLEYFNEMYFHNNTITINSTDTNSSVYLDTIRPATTTTNGRTTTLIDIVGNTFTNNGSRGDTIEFYRASSLTDHTHVVNLNYNHFIGNAVLQNKVNTECFNSEFMRATEFNCIGNTFERYQDFLDLVDMQNTPFVIEDNIFKNAGNNNFGSSGANLPLSLYVVQSNGGVIKNNTFFIAEEGTCIRLHSGVTNDVEIVGNSFIYLGDTRTDGEEYIILNINSNDLDEVLIDNNYYYGLEKLGDTTLFEYAPTATFAEAMALTDTDVTFHTTNLVKRDVVRPIASRMTKDIAWKV